MENIDVRMSNYIAILSNPNMAKNFDDATRRAMETALDIYLTQTAKKYLEDYQAKQRRDSIQEQFADRHEKLQTEADDIIDNLTK